MTLTPFADLRVRSRITWPRILLACLVAGQVALARAQDPSPAAQPGGVITTYENYWDVAGRQSRRPIRADILVTHYDPTWGNLWGEIDGVVGYMPCATRMPLRSGDRVRIEGTVVPRSGLSVETCSITVLERDVQIVPLDANGRVGDFDRFKQRLVTFEAIFDQQKLVDGEHVQMELIADGKLVHLYYWDPAEKLFDLREGAVVRVTGLYVGKHDPRTDVLEIDLWVARRERVELIGNLDSDPRFDLPISPIEQLSQLFLEWRGAAHIAGVVQSYTPGRGLTLRDDTGQVFVRTLQRLPMQIGDVVEAEGIPFTAAADWLLKDAVVRRASPEVAGAVMAAVNRPVTRLRLASQILDLSQEEAAQGRAVDLTGVIVWANPNSRHLFFHDTSGSVRVHMAESIDLTLLKAGTGIRLVGITTPGVYTPEVAASGFENWGSALLPEPKLATLPQAMTGREEGQRIELRGHVTRVTSEEPWTRLVLSTETGEFSAVIARDDDLDRLVGSIASVSGVCRAIANARRQLVGIEVWVSAPEDLRLEQAAPEDPFAVPLRKIGALRQFNAKSSLSSWARIRGVVTDFVPGRFAFVQDGAEGLMVLTQQTEPLAPGDVIEATGLPGMESQRVVLREAVYRVVDHQAEPKAVVLFEPRQVNDELESRLVRVQGTLISTVAEDDEISFAVQADDMVFAATVPQARGAADAKKWEPGSRIELTGVYEVVRDERRQASGFRLQLRTAADVAVLQRRSWWTPARAFIVTGALGGCIVLGLAWVFSLRRRVRRQTEQIRTQVAKEANLEARNREIVENASDCIFTIDLDGRFTSFNPAGERITGFSREQALQMNVRDLIAPEDAGRCTAAWLNPGADGATAFQSRLRRRDGTIIWAETSSRFINEAGRAVGVLGVVRDISERKQIEAQLERARDAAEANTHAKSAFLANMSHEIRTPMNGVIGMSNLLLDTKLDREQRDFAETIRNSAEALLTVLNDILDFSKIEAGKLHFESLDFDLGDAIEETLELLAARAASKQLELAGLVPPELPRKLRGDPGRLRQVLLNLVGNAVKFTDEGEVVVTVSREEESENDVLLRFEVSDTGIGLSEEAQERLFQPFSQADATTTRRFGGTGLGLAISRQIVELMGGHIGVRSKPGQGATFWFTTRLLKQAVPVREEAPAALESLRGLRVLAVDDNATNHKVVSCYSEGWHLRTDEAFDGPTALNLARAAAAAGDPYRLALLDFHMPGMDGIHLAQALHAEAAYAEMPVVLLTSVDRRLAQDEMGAMHIAAMLTKPIRKHELLAAIKRAVPAVADNAAPEKPATAAAPAVKTAPRDLPALRILVAEDNAVNQRLIQLQLKKLGLWADLAANGEEALEALERATYDVVLMDCQMPEMDGYETTRRMRGNPRHAAVRVIAMTANAMQGDRERCLEAGMDDYLSKPTRIEDLRSALSRCGDPVLAVTGK